MIAMLPFAFSPVYWLFMLPALLLGLYAQIKLTSTYSRYVEEPVESGLSGAEAAREILDRAGLRNVPVEEVQGHLTDHYDPRKRALFLSSENFHGSSLAAVGVAAHEAGHALQHQALYFPLHFRMALVPIAQFSSALWAVILFAGFLFSALKIALTVVIVLMAITTLFQLVTLPVEYDASRRAKQRLFELGIVSEKERRGVSQVLGAAALTYVAAMVSAVMQLLYYVSLARSSNRD